MRISDWSSDVCSSDLAYELGETRIAIGGGRTIRLSDVAKVSDGYAEQRNLATIGGRQVLSFSIERAKGASDVTVHDEAMKKLAQIEKNNPKVDFNILFTRSEEHTSELQSLMRISYAVFCLKKKKHLNTTTHSDI